MPVPPDKAEAINAGIPFSTAPIERARPFLLPLAVTQNLPAHQAAVDCLTAAIYYEAASETAIGQRAVAQVVLNRVRHPAFPKSICAVVYEGSERSTGCQFSFTCDGSLSRTPDRAGWLRARGVATAALGGSVEPAVGMATHYHTRFVVPYWAWTLDKVSLIGAHIFYRWQGYWGRRAAFTGVYDGGTDAVPWPKLDYGLAATDVGIDQVAAPPASGLLIDQATMPDTPGIAPAKTAAGLRADEERGRLAIDEQGAAALPTPARPALPAP
ncbi:cell wall hydrolase [Novosphingobium piscinae]|nr:cell wall hydrolase [Novosphingobium piscinae]